MTSDLDFFWFWLLANAADLRDVTVAAAAFAVLPFLAWRAWTARKLVEAQQRTAEATEIGKSAEIMAQAFAGLGDDKVQGRIGAVYSLERQARARPKDQGPIVQTLAAFIRDRCPPPAQPATAETVYLPIQTDVQAAIGVLGRRVRANDPIATRLSFAGSNLSGYDLSDGDFTGATFKGAYLCAANFAGTRLAPGGFPACRRGSGRFLRRQGPRSVVFVGLFRQCALRPCRSDRGGLRRFRLIRHGLKSCPGRGRGLAWCGDRQCSPARQGPTQAVITRLYPRPS